MVHSFITCFVGSSDPVYLANIQSFLLHTPLQNALIKNVFIAETEEELTSQLLQNPILSTQRTLILIDWDFGKHGSYAYIELCKAIHKEQIEHGNLILIKTAYDSRKDVMVQTKRDSQVKLFIQRPITKDMIQKAIATILKS